MKKIATAFLALGIASSAMANGIAMNQHTGTFAEMNVGTNLYYLGVASTSGSTGGAGVIGAAVSAALGYNFTPGFGLEGGIIQDEVDVNNGSSVTVPYFTTRFTVPMGERFSFIGKLGLMAPVVPDEGAFILPYTGIGISYAMTKNVDLSLQYQGAVYGIAGAGIAGLGLTYHFNM